MSGNEETPEQNATREEEVRTAMSEVVYPQRALTFLIIFVFVFLVALLIIGLIGLKWINQNTEQMWCAIILVYFVNSTIFNNL